MEGRKRKEINDKIVNWIKNKVCTEYAQDISLVLIYGSYINGTAWERSDVDCYFIPKTEHSYELAMDFIIDGVGYDLFPISWERAAEIADLKESMSPLIGDVKIIYCRSDEDRIRFEVLQERLKNNLSDLKYTKATARQRCEAAGEYYAQLQKMANMRNLTSAWEQEEGRKTEEINRLTEIRKLAGMLIMTLADAVAVCNQDYFHFGLKKQYEDLLCRFQVPSRIIESYRAVAEAKTAAEVKAYAEEMYRSVCEYLQMKPVQTPDDEYNDAKKAVCEYPQRKMSEGELENVSKNEAEIFRSSVAEAKKVNASALAGLYEEICSTFGKIYSCCESGNYILAFLSAVCLQRDLDDAAEHGCPAYPLLGMYDCKNLKEFAAAAECIENDFVQLIKKHGGQIKNYETFELFESVGL